MAVTFVLIALVIFAAGAAVGFVLVVSKGIRREERDFSYTRQAFTSLAPDQTSQATRRVTGLYVRQPGDGATTFDSRESMLV